MSQRDIFNHDMNLLGWFRAVKGERTYKDGRFPYSGMYIFTGSQGSGKTYSMIYLVTQIRKEYPDVPILTDIEMYGIDNIIQYRSIEDIDRYSSDKGLVVVLDEIHLLFSSLTSKDSSHTDLQTWSQNRKNNRLILGTSQRFSRIAKPIREQCSGNIEIRRGIFPGTNFYRYINAEDYDDSGKLILTGEERPKWNFFIKHTEIFKLYDTLYQIKGDICKK